MQLNKWKSVTLLAPVLLFFGVGHARASVALVQREGIDVASATSATLAFNSNNTAGNWIAVCIRAGRSGEAFTVTDSRGNTYHQAVQLNDTLDTPNGNTIAIFYAENISAGANTVTVADTISATLRFAILEYSGVATANSLDVTASTQGSSTSPNSGNATTTASGDLLLGAIATADAEQFTTPTGVEIEVFVPAEPNTKLIVEDKLQTAAGAAAASATLGASDPWGAILAAFKPASGGGTAPSILSLNPASGAVGAAVTVTGANFGTTQGTSTIKFNGTTATPTSWSATSIVVPVPSGATTGNVVVTVSGAASNGVTFTVVPPPSITSLNPTSGVVGASVTVTGANFGATQGSGTITFNGTAGAPTSWSATSIVVPVPSGATTGNVVVNASGVASNGVNFTVLLTPSITSLTPTAGGVGTSVTVTGTNFGTSQGTSTVTFNGIAGTPTSWSATSIVVPVPSGATTGNVVVTVFGVASNGVAFTVVPPPTITSFSPTSASVGTLITVTGTNFTANNATPVVTLVQQGGGGMIPASVSSASATNLSFVIPTGAGTGQITVTANSQSAVSSTSLTITAASSFTLSATPGTAPLLPGQTTTFDVTLASSNGFTQLASLSVSGLPSGVTGTFQPTQITAGQFSILTVTAAANQPPGATQLTVNARAVVQGITQSLSANVTLQVQGTSGVAFAGRVAVTDSYDTPLVGVTVSMLGKNQTGVPTGCTGTATTDGAGNFVMNGLSASCAGGQLIQYDPSTVTSPTGTYSGVTLSYQLTSGQVTTPGPPGFIVHLPRVDGVETFSVQQNVSVDQTFSSRTIPGVTITVYAGTTFTKADNTLPNPFPLSVVEIPYDRLPESMPPDPTKDPLFAMSIEPFNSSSSQPIAVSYPNRSKLPPGAAMPLTSLNPTMGIMVNYGTASVSADGSQVVPDFDSAHPGHRFGISHFDWHFPQPGPNALNPGMGGLTGGDPIDLASGLPVITKTDIVMGGARGQVAITRVFRGATTNPGPFGIGTNHNYGHLLDTTNFSGGLINLILPDGNQIPFVQSGGGTWGNTTLPSTQGAVLTNVVCTFGSGCSATLRWKNGTTYQFQPFPQQLTTASFLTSITDSNGNKTTLVRGANSSINQIIDPVGRSLSLTYDGVRRITTISDPIGRTVQYTYNPQGYLATVTDPNTPAGITTYGYDANNNLQTIKDARNITYLTNNTFDSIGRVTQQTTVDGGVTTFVYTLANPTIPTSPVLLTTVTDPLGNKTIYHFNPAGFVLDVTDALGRKTVYTRDSGTNLLLGVTDPLGRTTAFTYDSAGSTTSVTRLSGTPNAVTTSFTYEPAFNKLATVTDPLGHTTSLSYDKAGNLNQITDSLSNVTALGHDGAGELTAATDPMGNTTTLGYDGFGNLTKVTDPLGRIAALVPDAVGRTQSITNPVGQTAQYQYTALNQVKQITDPLNSQTSFTYDPNGNLLTVADALGSSHTTTYTYDNMDRVATRKDALLNSESYQYDLNENLTQFTDRRGKVTTFQYDKVNRRIFAGFGTTAGPTYESTINYIYDAGNRLVQVTDSVSGTIARAYDNLDRLISEVTPQGSVSYSYDAAGRRTAMSVGGQTSVGYSYDNANRLTQITQGSANVVIVPDHDGRRQSVTLPNGVTMAYGYDNASQLTGITYTLGANTLGNLTYTYDLAGRRAGVGGSYARTGVPQAASPATYNVNNQLTNWKGTNLTYDANGNLTNDGTNTYTWNARNQLAAISGGVAASFQYDPFGRRVSKTIGGITQYLYDGANPVQEISGTTASANLLTGGVDEYFQRTDPAGARSFLTDALGSTLALADSTGTLQTTYTFEPFGNTSVTGTATTNSFAYTGRELDATGLYFYRARYYNPQSQRFISEDPIEFGGGDVNLYGYLGQDPADDIDPLGLFGLDDFLNGLSDAIAGAGDSLTFGGTAAVRRLLNSGCDPANTSGTAYKVGEGIEVAAEIGLTLGSSALKQAAKEASRAVVRREARRLTADIVRGEGEVLHHVNPLFGHPGNIPTLFPTGGLPAALHSGPLNVALVDAAEHAGIHRATRALEQIGVSIVNPGTTTGRIIGNLIGRKSGCD